MYEVILTERAAEDLRVNYQWWAENRSVEQSHRWYRGILNAMISLEECPERFTLAEESPLFPFDAFQLNFGLGRNANTPSYFYYQRHDSLFCVSATCRKTA